MHVNDPTNLVNLALISILPSFGKLEKKTLIHFIKVIRQAPIQRQFSILNYLISLVLYGRAYGRF